ncbi:distal tail protein Dit [Sedimentibacter sp.]|uniref:distal tail protein Dit n=1 Tax=Sedimentibacter sp. TaxID=1960295 RepID=UPI0028AC421E|nr:distal tail protein Dit [Sedimentibacter sp.]
MAKLSRVRGFAFNDVVVDNLNFDLSNNIYLIDIKRNATPVKTNFDFIVPKRHGSQTFTNRYEDNFIDVTVGIYDNNISTRRTRQRTFLQSFIGVKSMLIFLDEPTLFYWAEVIDAIKIKEGAIFTEITIHFKASFCKYGLLGDANDIITNNADFITDEFDIITNSLAWENISLLTTKTVTNNGNFEATPLIEVYANTNCTSVIIDNGINSFTLSNLVSGETVYIDSEKMIVYTIEGNEKVSAMTRFTGQFINIPIGESMITIKGTSFDVNVSVEFRNTYIV